MIRDAVEKLGVGTGGFIGTIKLSNVNDVLAALVAIATIVYLVTSTIKRRLEIKILAENRDDNNGENGGGDESV